ncbi:MAG: UvrD-helicase domain-containing protein [Solirubrobacteraceae bacterium]|nr:UvrD-helicase domain-containing protein [Solirubrobacteraceae bacterium]
MGRPPARPPAPDVATSIPAGRLRTTDGRPLRALPSSDDPAPTFTARQARAVDDRPSTALLVSAGAGAGKTSVLVERFLRLLLEDDRVAARDVLAITFTERAATQMRDRVDRRLRDLVGGEPGRPVELPERLRTDDAWIGTFHGIAQRLLRRFAFDAGLDPDFVVASPDEAARLRRTAFSDAVAAWLRDVPEDDEGRRLLDLGLTGLRDQTLALLDLRRSQGADPGDPSAPGVPAAPDDQDALEAAARDAVDALRAAAAAATDEIGDVGDDAKKTVLQVLDACAEIAATDGTPTSPRLRAWAGAVRPAAAKELKGPACAGLRGAAQHACVAVDRVVVAPAARREVAARDALLRRTARRYADLKRRSRLLDFDDLLLRLDGLLRTRPVVAEHLRRRFRHVLVDEYQDTNPLQTRIVRALAGERGEDLFLVGDRLQAIYGFRNASTVGFDAAARAARDAGSLLPLDETFRCPRAVIALTNHVGRAAHDGYQPLVGGHGRPPAAGDDPVRVAVHVVGTGRDVEPPAEPDRDDVADADGVPFDPDAAPMAPEEARHVVALVRSLLAPDATGRAYRPSDVAVICRAKTRFTVLERALLDAGVDVVPAAGAPLLGTLEVRELEAWLRAAANPYDDVALLGALRLPTGGVDADALYALGAYHRSHRTVPAGASSTVPLWDTLRQLDVDDLLAPPRARDALEAQTTLLVQHRALALRLAPAELVARIVADDGYRAGILARPGGARRWAAVQLFLDWVAERQLAGDTLDRLVARIADGRDDGPTVPVLAGGDAVTITTIHRAKGLEWPVVIVADTGHRGRTDRPPVLLDPDPTGTRIGVAPKLDGDRVPLWDHADLDAARRREEARELRRLAHVALTRAADRLYVVGAWKAADDDGARRLKADAAVPLDGEGAHDGRPYASTLSWLLPLVAPADAWPAVGEDRVLRVVDPADPDGPAEPVLLRVVDPDGPVDDAVAPSAEASDDRPIPGASDGPDDEPAKADVAGAAAAAVLGRLTADDGPDAVGATDGPGGVGGDGPAPGGSAADDPDPVESVWEDESDEAADAPYPLPSPTSFSALSARLPDATVDPEGAARDGVDEPPDVPAVPVATASASTPAGRRAAEGPTLAARTRGVAVHALLEDRLAPSGGRMTASGPVDARAPSADEVRRAVASADRAARPSDAEIAEIAGAVEALLSGPTGRAIVRSGRRRAVELPILVQLDERRPLVQGYVDLWLRDPDHTVTVVDWKTNHLDPGASPAEVVEHGYHLQRAVYALAALEHGAPKVQVVFAFSAAPDRPVLAAYGPTDRDRLRAEVVDAIDRAERVPPPA